MAKFLLGSFLLVFFALEFIYTAEDWQFGAGHTYPCHCNNGSDCDVTNGACADGCNAPMEMGNFWVGNWTGDGCQIGNIAYQKPAEQGPDTSGEHNASNAVDGHLNAMLNDGHCSYAHDGTFYNRSAWWTVDLLERHVILGVTVYNRDTNQVRLSQTFVEVGNGANGSIASYEACGYISNGNMAEVTVACTRPVIGQFVRLRRDDSGMSHENLVLCEVLVEGYLYKDCVQTWGPGCLTPCRCSTQCDRALGTCSGVCDNGWIGSKCDQVCNPGTWGHKCESGCNCENSSEVCHYVTGACPISGCPETFVGTGCDAMPPTYTRKPNITDIAERSVKVRFPSWSAGSDNGSPATDYLIQHRVNGTDAWTSGDPLGLNRNALLYTVLLTNLEPETVYDVRIRPLLFHDGTLFYGTPGNYTTITTLSDAFVIDKSLALQVGIPVAVLVIIAVILAIYVKTQGPVAPILPPAARQRRVTILDQPLPDVPVQPTKSAIVDETDNAESGIYHDLNELPKRINITQYINLARAHSCHVTVAGLASHILSTKKQRNGFKKEFMGAFNASKQNVKKADQIYSTVLYSNMGAEANILARTKSVYIQASGEDNKYLLVQDQCKVEPDIFWDIIWSTQANRIVVLANNLTKPNMYWPTQDMRRYGPFHVKLMQSDYNLDYLVRNLSVVKGEESRSVTQYFFFNWPEDGVPLSTPSLLKFVDVLKKDDDHKVGPLVVHCSPTLARSSTFLAIDYALDEAAECGRIDIYGYAVLLFTCLGEIGMTQRQYRYVYEAVLEYLEGGDTVIPTVRLEEAIPPDTQTKLEREYKSMMALTVPVGRSKYKSTFSEKYSYSTIPGMVVRPQHTERGRNSYVRANSIEKSRRQHLVIPSPKNARLFWRLVHDKDCRTIVVLDEPGPEGQNWPRYCPRQVGKPMKYGSTMVTLLSDDQQPLITKRQFSVGRGSEFDFEVTIVQQFELNAWWDCEEVPEDPKHLAQLLEAIDQWYRSENVVSQPMVVHGGDSDDKACFFAAASMVAEQLRQKQEIDIFKAFIDMRRVQPEHRTTVEQYRHLYSVAYEFSQNLA